MSCSEPLDSARNAIRREAPWFDPSPFQSLDHCPIRWRERGTLNWRDLWQNMAVCSQQKKPNTLRHYEWNDACTMYAQAQKHACPHSMDGHRKWEIMSNAYPFFLCNAFHHAVLLALAVLDWLSYYIFSWKWTVADSPNRSTAWCRGTLHFSTGMFQYPSTDAFYFHEVEACIPQ